MIFEFLDAPDWARRSPDPRRLPTVRAVVTHWLKHAGANFYWAMIMSGSQAMGVDATTPSGEIAGRLAREERRRVSGSLYWVDAAMTQLAQRAGRELPRHELYPYDLPSPSGFMVFAEPLAVLQSRFGDRVEIVAVSWGPWDGPAGSAWTDGGVWMTFYAGLPQRTYLAEYKQVAVDLGVADVGPLMPENEAGWPFGELNSFDVPADSTGVWARTVCAAWLLMQQPLTETVTTAALPASAKRRMRRARVAVPDGGVQIIRMRRRERGPGGRGPGRDGQYTWKYQTEVPGFWRRYHVGPGRTRVERKWIDDYWAGPPDAPIRNVERVHVWDR